MKELKVGDNALSFEEAGNELLEAGTIVNGVSPKDTVPYAKARL